VKTFSSIVFFVAAMIFLALMYDLGGWQFGLVITFLATIAHQLSRANHYLKRLSDSCTTDDK
jgi:uncharacterized membrane protein